MAELEKLSEQELDSVAGGYCPGDWVVVHGLETGYLALRTAPCYDYGNEIRGSESYNGQTLQVCGGYAYGSDKRTYVWVMNPRSKRVGWVNASFV